jgi:hypothetical protein
MATVISSEVGASNMVLPNFGGFSLLLSILSFISLDTFKPHLYLMVALTYLDLSRPIKGYLGLKRRPPHPPLKPLVIQSNPIFSAL